MLSLAQILCALLIAGCGPQLALAAEKVGHRQTTLRGGFPTTSVQHQQDNAHFVDSFLLGITALFSSAGDDKPSHQATALVDVDVTDSASLGRKKIGATKDSNSDLNNELEPFGGLSNWLTRTRTRSNRMPPVSIPLVADSVKKEVTDKKEKQKKKGVKKEVIKLKQELIELQFAIGSVKVATGEFTQEHVKEPLKAADEALRVMETREGKLQIAKDAIAWERDKEAAKQKFEHCFEALIAATQEFTKKVSIETLSLVLKASSAYDEAAWEAAKHLEAAKAEFSKMQASAEELQASAEKLQDAIANDVSSGRRVPAGKDAAAAAEAAAVAAAAVATAEKQFTPQRTEKQLEAATAALIVLKEASEVLKDARRSVAGEDAQLETAVKVFEAADGVFTAAAAAAAAVATAEKQFEAKIGEFTPQRTKKQLEAATAALNVLLNEASKVLNDARRDAAKKQLETAVKVFKAAVGVFERRHGKKMLEATNAALLAQKASEKLLEAAREDLKSYENDRRKKQKAVKDGAYDGAFKRCQEARNIVKALGKVHSVLTTGDDRRNAVKGVTYKQKLEEAGRIVATARESVDYFLMVPAENEELAANANSVDGPMTQLYAAH